MASKTRAAKPAAPQLPDHLTPADPQAHRLHDESQWWRLAIHGYTDPGVQADGFEVEQCRLDKVDLSGGQWDHGVWRDCAFADTNLANLQARRCLLQRSTVSTVRATGLQWTDGTVKDVTFTGSRLDLAGFRFSKLPHVVFKDCRLAGCDFTNADLSGVRFVDCDLTGAKLHHATMTGARIDNCQLDGITGVDAMRGATVAGPDLLALTYSLADACGITVESVNGRP